MADRGDDALDDLLATVGRSAPPVRPVRAASDLLSLPDDQQEVVRWLVRHGEATLEEIARGAAGGDAAAAEAIVAALLGQSFVEEVRVGGVSRYHARLQTRPARQLPASVWQVLYERVGDVFDHEGEEVALVGNRPLALDDPEAVYLVRAGQVHVYGVADPAGPRDPLFALGPGAPLFGLGRGECLLVVLGGPETRLRRLSRARLSALAADERLRAEVLGLVAAWVDALAGLLGPERAPTDARSLGPGDVQTVRRGTVLRALTDLVWLSTGAGRVDLAGRAAAGGQAPMAWIPLPHRLWAVAVERSQVRVVGTAEWHDQDPAWAALDAYHAFVLAAYAEDRVQAAVRLRERLERREAAERRAVATAVLTLASPLDARARALAQASAAGEDPLAAAFRLVLESIGLGLRPASTGDTGRRRADPVAALSRACRVRTRQVALRAGWWQNDGAGPMLAYMAGRPVALLPAGRGFVIADPTSPTRIRVGPATAGLLDPIAVSVYRPFPAAALSLGALLRFGLAGLGPSAAAIPLWAAVAALLALAPPILTAVLFNSILPAHSMGDLGLVVVALVAAAISAAAFQTFESLVLLKVEGSLSARLQAAVWDRLLQLPTAFFRRFNVGELTQRAMGIEAIRQVLTASVTGALLSAVFSLFSWALLFVYDARLALIATLIGLAALAATVLGGVAQVRYQRAIQALHGRVYGQIVQLITGIAKLRVAGAEGRAFRRWSELFAQKWSYSIASAVPIVPALIGAIPVVGTLLIFALVLGAHGTTLAVGSFLAFLTAFNQFTLALAGGGQAVTSALFAVPFYERLTPILASPPEDQGQRADPGALSGAVELSHISFRYAPSQPPLLRDISIRAEPGQFVALVGPSGTGKTTLFRLLLGFEEPEGGAVYYDGQDLKSLDLAAVRRQIGVVLQNGRIQADEMYRCIIGSANLSLDDAWEAARMAGLEDDIREMPMGMQTMVPEGGSTLSGGQRQRLLIARAIVTKPRLLLFDEATSALDNRTQAIIGRSLESLHATRIVIAHRLSTVVNADRIYVLEGGTVAQEGSYEELMAVPGTFRNLARRQLA